jgi:hypothetical protein
MKILATTEAAFVATVALFAVIVWFIIDMIQMFHSAPIAS